MKVLLLTKECPPYIYGGAGVHLAYISRELGRLENESHDINILCFGDQDECSCNISIKGILPRVPDRIAKDGTMFQNSVLMDTLSRNLAMSGSVETADLVHCHTWYTYFAGCLLKQLLDIPLVLTTHSLEPHRPWKREQLGAGYSVSKWLEKTAYENADGIIAVSESMKKDVQTLYAVSEDKIEVIPNGIDDNQYKKTINPDLVRSYGIDPDKPFILMVARITKQKGIIHFLEAAKNLKSDVQVVLCASAPDTPQYMNEVSETVSGTKTQSGNCVIWIKDTVPVDDLIVLYSHAKIFVCPSVYEPFGIILLEAMACGVPVVASAVGGIPGVIADGETGRLVSFEPIGKGNPEPRDPARFARDLAEQIDELLNSPEILTQMGHSARKRVSDNFTWSKVAEKTLTFYKRLIKA